MKKVSLLMLVSILFSTLSFSQEYQKIDSVKLSKSELREATVSYISEKWKSANDVIQMNSENQILIKGSKKVGFPMSMYYNTYWFNYTIKFQFKENKVKMTISNIYNEYGVYSGKGQHIAPLKLEYKDINVCPSAWKTNASKKKVVKAMQNLDNDFNLMLIDYFTFLIDYNTEKSDW